MSESENNNVSKNRKANLFAKVYIHAKRVAPSIVAGGILALAIFLFAKTQQATPPINEFQITAGSRTNYFSEQSPTTEKKVDADLITLVESLSPKMERLRREIYQLKKTDTEKWKRQKKSIMQAWKQVDEQYEKINASLSNG